MSASFSLKIIRINIAVKETGNIIGKIIFQKRGHLDAPSTFAASNTSLGRDCIPAKIMIIINGIYVQLSIIIIINLAISGEEKKAGESQPKVLAKRVTGPNLTSSIDFPIIQLTATGLSINGKRKETRKNFLATIFALSNKANPNAIEYSTRIKKKYKYVEAKKGSIVFFLGQTWHQIGKNTNFKSRWGVLCHYKRWWIKPSTDFTKCGPAIYKLLNRKQKELFGFNSISPKFNLKKQTKVLKILRSTDKLSSKYSKAIRY